MSLNIRRVRPGEAGLVLSFVRELAEYEKLLHEVEATEADLDSELFGANPRLFCEIAEWNGEAVGFAVWFVNYSTFSGRAGIVSGGPVRPPGAARQGNRQGATGASCKPMHRQRLVAAAMVGARLEHAVD